MSSSGPVFIAGGDRSGLGLVGELLEMHPAFSITRRTNYFAYYDGRFGDLNDPENVNRLLAALSRDRRFGQFSLDVAPVVERLASGDRTYGRIFEIIQEDRMARMGRRRWGDKSLWSEAYADAIFGSYPNARMVQVVRDPRDQFASFKFHRRGGEASAAVGAAMWRRSMYWASRNLRLHEGRYEVLRYEDLVEDPQRHLANLCGFLGEEFDPTMLTESGSASGADGAPKTIRRSSVGRYRTDLSEGEIAVIQRANGRRMREFGYEVDDLGRKEMAIRVRLAVSAVQMLAWDARSRLRHWRGSSPSDDRLSG